MQLAGGILQHVQAFVGTIDLLVLAGFQERGHHGVDQVVQVLLVFFLALDADSYHVGVGHRSHIDGLLQLFDVAPFRQVRGPGIDTSITQLLQGGLQHVVADHGLRQLVHILAVLRVRLQFEFGVGLQVLHVAWRDVEHRFHVVDVLALDEHDGHAQDNDGKPHDDAGLVVFLQALQRPDSDAWLGVEFHKEGVRG